MKKPRNQKPKAEKPEDSAAEANAPAVEHPRRVHPPGGGGYDDKQLRPDRFRGGFDTKSIS